MDTRRIIDAINLQSDRMLDEFLQDIEEKTKNLKPDDKAIAHSSVIRFIQGVLMHYMEFAPDAVYMLILDFNTKLLIAKGGLNESEAGE